jgi:growth factor-regulated tyrosine kinase substrate
MLEERLSKAYSQHSIGGYNLPPPRQAAGPYPSLQPSAPSAAGPAENFYTGEQQQDYNHPTAHPSYPQPAPVQYGAYDKRGSVAGPPSNQYPPQQMPQHTGNWGPAPPTQQYGQQPTYPPTEPPQAGQPQHTPTPAHLSAPTPIDSVGTTPTADPSASFYFNSQSQQPQQQQAPSSPPDPAMSPYPNLAQPMHSYQPSLPQTPASIPAQPSQPLPQPQQTQQPQQPHQAPPQAQQPYWQHSAAQQTQLPPVWQPPPTAAYAGYTQEAFPSAPHHAPKQPVVEESLIDL